MANDDKLEPRLLTFIDEQKVRASARGMSAAEVEEQQSVQVTISHQEDVQATEGQPGEGQARQTALASLEHRVHELQAPVLAKLAEIGVEPDRQHVLTNAVTATLTPAQIRQVAGLDEVKLMRLESFDQVTTMNESVEVIEAREVWDQLGDNGRGIRVAVLDTGIDEAHPALLGKVVDRVSTASEPITVPGAHGTHTAGTVASNDPIYRGVAWQADLINIKVLTAGGFGQPQSVIDGLDQAVRRDALVASLSLGWSEIFHGWVCNDADCILCQAADNAVRLGVTVVVAAGNEGNLAADPANAGKSNIRHPGAARRVVTVGAVDKAKVLAPFSSIGPGTARLSPGSAIRWTKPDVAGPGVNIVSSVLGGGFAAFSGTSMATPHVAGVAALILQRFPDATPAMVKKHLEDTGEVLPYAPNEAGYGLVNAFGAMIYTLTVK
jgi:serine protease AprX